MPEPIRKSSHIRTSSRRPGKRLSAEERKTAQDTFLKAFASNGNVRAACMAARIDRSLIYQWLEKDVAFTVLYHEAEKDADDAIRAAIFKRAIYGYEKPVVSMGKIVYDKDGKPLMETVYSDALLALLAKARMHEFREKQQLEHTGKDGGPIEVSDVRERLTQKINALRQSQAIHPSLTEE